eukprot:g18991.t1
MREGTITEASFKLELQAPQLRPEAFPWGSADVDIHAIVNNTGTQGCRRVISLPGVMDLSALVFAGEKANDHSELSYSLGVEIVGYDHGITFALGNAFIPLPPSTRQSSSVSKSQFRVSVTGEEGVRNGTLVGNIQACGPAGDNPEAGEAVGVRASKFYRRPADGDVRQESGGEADDVRRAHDGVAAEEASKVDLLIGQYYHVNDLFAARPSGGPAARISTHESTNESTCHCRDELRERRVLQVPPPDTSGDVNVGDPGSTVGSALSSKEEDELPISPRFPTAGFKFEPTTGNVEWQRIASVNVSKVEREGDLQTLRQFLPDVAVGMVDEDDFDANPGLVNAFRLAQLQTQYVLHCSQLLQRQCDRLETAVASMELETKGNSQGSTALKSRARLLRKERRKQDKIIVGYAAMLRTHNPGLSSKVFLDKNGRLKVHKKASRHRERERRRTNKRRNRGCRDDERETLENKMYNANNFGSRSGTGTEGPTLDSPGDSNDRFPEAGGPPPEFGIQRPRSRNAGTRTSSVAEEDEWSAFRLDPGEDDTASRIERDQTIRARRSDGNTMMPRRRRRTTDTADEGHARMSDDDVVHQQQQQQQQYNGSGDRRTRAVHHTSSHRSAAAYRNNMRPSTLAAAASSALAWHLRDADGHCFQTKPISRQYLHTAEFNADEKYGYVEKWAGAFNGGGPGVIEQRQKNRTDPAILEKYGGGEVWPFAAAWDLGEALPNNNYLEIDELAVSRNGVCGDTPQGADDNPVVYSTATKYWDTLAEYEAGQVIEIDAIVTAYHWGHFEFLLCDTDSLDDPDGVPKQSCFNEYPLDRADDDDFNSPIDPNFPGRYYADPPCRGETGETDQTRPELGPGLMKGTVNHMRYKLPDGLTCKHCILMMRYFSGNTCKHPGYDEFNPPSWPSECAPNKEDWIDTTAGECRRPQARWGNVFMGCSDISIKSSTGYEGEGEPKDDNGGEGKVEAEHLGCFHDNKRDRVLGDIFSSSDMTPAACSYYCSAKGATFMAVQYGFECWCSAASDLDYTRHNEITAEEPVCDYPCFGDTTLTCGGYTSFNLYKLRTCEAPVEAYEQCGGVGYTGSTCCAGDNECIDMSAEGLYSECRPN